MSPSSSRSYTDSKGILVLLRLKKFPRSSTFVPLNEASFRHGVLHRVFRKVVILTSQLVAERISKASAKLAPLRIAPVCAEFVRMPLHVIDKKDNLTSMCS
jgi:hypothetical protein